MDNQGLLIKTDLDHRGEPSLSITYGMLPYGLDINIHQEKHNEYFLTFSKKDFNGRKPIDKNVERNTIRIDLYEYCKDIIENYRACGNTTRMVDAAVHLLFNNYIVIVRDHAHDGNYSKQNVELFRKIENRILNEHKHLINSGEFIADHKRLIVKLINKAK